MSELISASRIALAIALFSIGCAPAPESPVGGEWLNLTEVVPFQQDQVSTDLISVSENIGLDQVGYGWWQETDDVSGESWLRLAAEVGQMRLFSADGDLEQIEIELSGSGSREPQPKIRIRLNGERLEQVPAPGDWTSLKIEIPPHLGRRGTNLLEFAQASAKKQRSADVAPRMRLRRIRIRSSSGRKLWPTRPQKIAAIGSDLPDGGTSSALEMPIASYLELVVPVPEAARLQGRFQFEPQSGSAKEPVYLYVELLDYSNKQQTLFHERFYKRMRRAQDLNLDLSAWEGEVVRVRIGATGTGNGVFRWTILGVPAAEPVALASSLPPITRQMPPRSGKLGKPDVLVILLDAARADAFSPWGGPHPTPAIERLAEDGTVFANATSPAPWTGQSVPSIMTGLFPDTLGVGPWGSQLPDRVPTLAEMMAQAGYRTVLWSQHPLYSNHQSFRRGFQEYYRTPRGAYQSVPGAEVLIAADQPTFAFVHLIPPHAPYTPPAPFRGAYSSGYTGSMKVDAARLNSYPRKRDPESVTELDRRYVFDRYLENAAFADDLVARILDPLTRAGRYDETLVVLLSDHGEAFLEHGHFLHTKLVNREMLHVPFVLKWPKAAELASATFENPVSLVDLVPTLVDGLALENEGGGFQGVSLMPPAVANRPVGRPIYAMTRGGHGAQSHPRIKLMLETDGWRLLWSPDRKLFNLYRSEIDPLEKEDLAAKLPMQALLLRQAALSQWHSNKHLLHTDRAVTEKVEELDPEVIEELEALGYLN